VREANTLLNKTLLQRRLGANVDLVGLIGIYQQVFSDKVQLEQSIANYRVARSTIDRMLLEGYYARF
jgi:hypothetical protein